LRPPVLTVPLSDGHLHPVTLRSLHASGRGCRAVGIETAAELGVDHDSE
jgi:hypothetical protein